MLKIIFDHSYPEHRQYGDFYFMESRKWAWPPSALVLSYDTPFPLDFLSLNISLLPNCASTKQPFLLEHVAGCSLLCIPQFPSDSETHFSVLTDAVLAKCYTQGQQRTGRWVDSWQNRTKMHHIIRRLKEVIRANGQSLPEAWDGKKCLSLCWALCPLHHKPLFFELLYPFYKVVLLFPILQKKKIR